MQIQQFINWECHLNVHNHNKVGNNVSQPLLNWKAIYVPWKQRTGRTYISHYCNIMVASFRVSFMCRKTWITAFINVVFHMWILISFNKVVRKYNPSVYMRWPMSSQRHVNNARWDPGCSLCSSHTILDHSNEYAKLDENGYIDINNAPKLGKLNNPHSVCLRAMICLYTW